MKRFKASVNNVVSWCFSIMMALSSSNMEYVWMTRFFDSGLHKDLETKRQTFNATISFNVV